MAQLSPTQCHHLHTDPHITECGGSIWVTRQILVLSEQVRVTQQEEKSKLKLAPFPHTLVPAAARESRGPSCLRSSTYQQEEARRREGGHVVCPSPAVPRPRRRSRAASTSPHVDRGFFASPAAAPRRHLLVRVGRLEATAPEAEHAGPRGAPQTARLSSSLGRRPSARVG